MFPGEEECVFDGVGELSGSLDATFGDVAIGAKREGIIAPIVIVAGDQKLTDLGRFEREDAGQGGAGAVGYFVRGEAG